MIIIELTTNNYEIKKIKNYTPTSAGIILPKKYINKKIAVIPILGTMKTEMKDGITKIRVESNYIKEITPENNKLYLPKTYKETDCIIAEIIN